MINLFCKIMLQKVSIHSMVKLFSCEKKFCHIFVDLMSISSCPTLPSQDHFLFKFNFLKCQNYNTQMRTSHFGSGRAINEKRKVTHLGFSIFLASEPRYFSGRPDPASNPPGRVCRFTACNPSPEHLLPR